MKFYINRFLVNIDYVGTPVQIGATDLQNPISVASFVYETAQNPGLSLAPTKGDLVEIVDTNSVYCLYLGHIAQVERGGDPIAPRYAISCQDLNYLLEKIRLPSDWIVPAGLGDGWLVFQLLASWGGNDAFGSCVWPSNNSAPGNVIPLSAPFANLVSKASALPGFTVSAGASVADALRRIAGLVGGTTWRIDERGFFHWNDAGTLAPWVLTTESPDNWPSLANAFYGYSEFADRTGHYFRVRVDNGAGLSATATDWPAFGDAHAIHSAGGVTGFPHGSFFAGEELYLQGPNVSDSSLTTQALVDARSYAELSRGRVRKTVRLSLQRSVAPGPLPIGVGQLVDVVHRIWGPQDVTPTPHVTREAGTHSNIRGELVPYSRGRFLIQKVTPKLLKSQTAADVIAYDLELGDYEDGLAATLARVV